MSRARDTERPPPWLPVEPSTQRIARLPFPEPPGGGPATMRITQRIPELDLTPPAPATPERVLFVDDEPRVLEALERTLGDAFDVVSAPSAPDAIAWLEHGGPFAALVTDMRMPGMDGAALLARAAELAPDTTRMLLTGHADLSAAVQAINDGRIFRMLVKPCPTETLRRHVEDAIRQHRLVVAERELLERTLTGSIELLTDLLGLTAPGVFSRASRLRHAVHVAATKLGLRNAWECELAALLCLIGCITLPHEIVERAWAGVKLTPDERTAFDHHPAIAHKLLSSIPRLERIAEIVRRQRTGLPTREPDLDRAVELLRAALDRDELAMRGVRGDELSRELRRRQHAPDLIAALSGDVADEPTTVRGVPLVGLTPGVILDSDVVTPAGAVLVKAGVLVSAALIERLHKIAAGVGVAEPIYCHAP